MVNDSLSKRSLQKEFELIKIPPARPIIVYTMENCTNCKGLVASLEQSPYQFKHQNLDEKPEIREQLSQFLVTNPLINMGGVLHDDIENYAQLLDVLKKYKEKE